MQRIPQEKLEQWLFDLNAPLPGQQPKAIGSGDIAAEEEGLDFMEAMAMNQQMIGG